MDTGRERECGLSIYSRIWVMSMRCWMRARYFTLSSHTIAPIPSPKDDDAHRCIQKSRQGVNAHWRAATAPAAPRDLRECLEQLLRGAHCDVRVRRLETCVGVPLKRGWAVVAVKRYALMEYHIQRRICVKVVHVTGCVWTHIYTQVNSAQEEVLRWIVRNTLSVLFTLQLATREKAWMESTHLLVCNAVNLQNFCYANSLANTFTHTQTHGHNARSRACRKIN